MVMLEKQRAQKSGESSCFSSLTLKYFSDIKRLIRFTFILPLKEVFTPVIEGH